MWKNLFSSFFFKYTNLSHLKSNYNFLFASNFFVLIRKIVKNDDDATKHGKIMWYDYYFLEYHMYLTSLPTM